MCQPGRVVSGSFQDSTAGSTKHTAKSSGRPPRPVSAGLGALTRRFSSPSTWTSLLIRRFSRSCVSGSRGPHGQNPPPLPAVSLGAAKSSLPRACGLLGRVAGDHTDLSPLSAPAPALDARDPWAPHLFGPHPVPQEGMEGQHEGVGLTGSPVSLRTLACPESADKVGSSGGPT